MKQGFNRNSHTNSATVTLDQLRSQVVARLATAETKVDMKGNFRAASAGAEDGLLGSLLFNMLTWVPMMEALELATGGEDSMLAGLNDPILCAAFDGLSVVFDDRAHNNRHRKLDLYPQGRRQDPLQASTVNKKFNLVAANQNYRLDADVHAEIACMNEMLDMLKDLEKQGVSQLRVDVKTPVYDTLKTATRNISRKSGLNRFNVPVRKAA